MAYDTPHNHQPPLYLPALILLALVILQIGEIKKAESIGYDSIAQSECAKINQAENLYFAKHNKYTGDLKRLKVNLIPDVSITIRQTMNRRFKILAISCRHNKGYQHFILYKKASKRRIMKASANQSRR